MACHCYTCQHPDHTSLASSASQSFAVMQQATFFTTALGLQKRMPFLAHVLMAHAGIMSKVLICSGSRDAQIGAAICHSIYLSSRIAAVVTLKLSRAAPEGPSSTVGTPMPALLKAGLSMADTCLLCSSAEGADDNNRCFSSDTWQGSMLRHWAITCSCASI